MKKFIVLAVVLVLAACVIPVSAGDEVTAVKSDIAAYVNGEPIWSCNIDGNTYIIAEDLWYYGFSLFYPSYPFENLYIYCTYGGRYNGGGIAPDPNAVHDYDPHSDKTPIGTVYRLEENTIRTFFPYFGDEIIELETYKLDGYTLMRFDDLRWFGKVTWYPDERELHFNEYEPWSFDSNEIGKEINRPADDDAHILFEAVRGDDGEFVYIGENVDKIWWYFIDTWIYDGIHTYIGTYYTEWQPDKLLEVFRKSASFIDGVEVNNSSAYANEHILLYINGKKVGISDVRFDPTGNIWAVNIYFDIAYISLDEIQSITLRIE